MYPTLPGWHSAAKRAAAVLVIGLATLTAGAAERTRVVLAYVGGEQGPAYAGVRLGVDEANQQGRFLGREYTLDLVAPEAAGEMDLSPYLAVIADVEATALQGIAAAYPDHAVFNVRADDDALREQCGSNLLHVVPSARMKRDAVAQWRQKHGDSDVEARAWHPDFVKFAARDLNKRFMTAYDAPMDDGAWAGWAAVRMTSDSVARGKAASAPALLAHLRGDLSFDGQKGMEMDFRATGQLRQILLLVADGELLGEAPVRGVVPMDPDDAIDTLGRAECPE